MKDSKEFMNEFMNNWKNMIKYQDVKLNPIDPNYEEFEKAYCEEKKIVQTVEKAEERNIRLIGKNDELER